MDSISFIDANSKKAVSKAKAKIINNPPKHIRAQATLQKSQYANSPTNSQTPTAFTKIAPKTTLEIKSSKPKLGNIFIKQISTHRIQTNEAPQDVHHCYTVRNTKNIMSPENREVIQERLAPYLPLSARSKSKELPFSNGYHPGNNIDKRKITWSFTKYKADKKLSKHYVS